MSYEMCGICNRPLINENNLQALRIILSTALGTATVGIIGACALPFLGFGLSGITAGSFAASWQGSAVAAGSLFAVLQSLGATGLGMLLFGAVGSVVGAGVGAGIGDIVATGALGLIYTHRELFGWCTCN